MLIGATSTRTVGVQAPINGVLAAIARMHNALDCNSITHLY
jgi:hypothetical protein